MNDNTEKMQKAFSILEDVYNEIPKTKGCKNACKPNGCHSWCCAYMTPSMYACEFLYLWRYFLEKSSKEEQAEIVVKAVENYLRNKVTKQCVFFDPSSYLCKIHNKRPLACRLYAIIHPHTWKERAKIFKQQFESVPLEDKKDVRKILNQCGLVKTIEGKNHVSRQEEEKWFNETKKAEKEFGIKESTIEKHDDPEGTYRSMHDHIMLNSFAVEFLNSLSEQRTNRLSEDDILKFGKVLKESLVKYGK